LVGIPVVRREDLFKRLIHLDQTGGVLMDPAETPSSPVDASSFAYVVGIDIGSERCSFCTLKSEKSQVIKPTEFANAMPGFSLLQKHLELLGVAPDQILIGIEATSRYGENLYHFLEQRGYQLWRLASTPDTSICPPTRAAGEN
jgi:hypothetical protein